MGLAHDGSLQACLIPAPCSSISSVPFPAASESDFQSGGSPTPDARTDSWLCIDTGSPCLFVCLPEVAGPKGKEKGGPIARSWHRETISKKSKTGQKGDDLNAAAGEGKQGNARTHARTLVANSIGRKADGRAGH